MFIRFLLVGGIGFCIDVGLTYLLIFLSIAPWIARIPAITLAMTFTWFANRYFTYKVNIPRSITEGIRYSIVALSMALVNYLIYLLLIRYGILAVISVTIATAFQVLISFYAYRRFVFIGNSNIHQNFSHLSSFSLNFSKQMISRSVLLAIQAMSIGLMSLILIKSLVDVDQHADSWWYHLPWAARLGGIINQDSFLFEPIAANRFEGFPLLPEFIQGLFWRITGRVECANLVSFASFGAFIFFLRKYFNIEWWISIPAFLAVPLVQAQVTSTYTDLIANLAMTALMMLIFKIYTDKSAVCREIITLIVVTSFIAANSKLQIIPLVALALMATCYPLTLIVLKNRDTHNKSSYYFYYIFALLSLSIIFFVPIKNIILHQNPFYPIKISLFGAVLNYAETPPPSDLGAGALTNTPMAIKWLYSVFEIGMGSLSQRVWSVDSSEQKNMLMGIQGGLFGAYVTFHLILFFWLITRVNLIQRKSAIFLFGSTMLLAAIMPASHLLRYYMFWFLFLISLNLYFFVSTGSRLNGWPNGIVFLIFLLIVIDVSDQNFVRPQFRSVNNLLNERINNKILKELNPNINVCLALPANQPFLYASFWHHKNYTIKAGPYFPDNKKDLEQTCKGWKIIGSLD